MWLGVGQSSNCFYPVLDLWTHIGGVLFDVQSLEFEIYDKSDEDVGPVLVQSRTAVDVSQLCPVGGKISNGHYVATWSVPPTANVGLHEIRWYFVASPGGPEITCSACFDVLKEPASSFRCYSNINDVICLSGINDEVPAHYIVNALERACSYIDCMTRRNFFPTKKTITLDGSGCDFQILPEPIIAIEKVEVAYCGCNDWQEIPLHELKVYNRHLSENLTCPDDREAPKIQLCPGSCYKFDKGCKNVRITGIFGYTEYDGSPSGKTPSLISWAAAHLAAQFMKPTVTVGDETINTGGTGGTGNTGVVKFDPNCVKKEKTMDQEVVYFSPAEKSGTSNTNTSAVGRNSGPFTANIEIDRILMKFRKPGFIGCV